MRMAGCTGCTCGTCHESVRRHRVEVTCLRTLVAHVKEIIVFLFFVAVFLPTNKEKDEQ